MKQESFVFYRSFYEAIKKFDKDIIADIMIGLCSYALDDEIVEFDNIIAESLFTLIKPQIDANKVKRLNGSSGGRPRKHESIPESVQENKEKKPPVFINDKNKKPPVINLCEEKKPPVLENALEKKPNVNVNVNENVNVIKEKITKKESQGATETFDSVIESFTADTLLKQRLHEYVDMRKKIKKGYTTNALRLNLNKLKRLAEDDLTKMIQIVEQSIGRSYMDFYAVSEGNYTNAAKASVMPSYNVTQKKDPNSLTPEERKKREELIKKVGEQLNE